MVTIEVSFSSTFSHIFSFFLWIKLRYRTNQFRCAAKLALRLLIFTRWSFKWSEVIYIKAPAYNVSFKSHVTRFLSVIHSLYPMTVRTIFYTNVFVISRLNLCQVSSTIRLVFQKIIKIKICKLLPYRGVWVLSISYQMAQNNFDRPLYWNKRRIIKSI